ncbi:hypothetical protein [Dawidia soli]|uniref:Uncharacterized protein n=1 Tax=Dawidia soli TaxID=2782352 RepID=A0AAP2GGB7_9BACT|nr:hypothetical protein [Dawidia soli]MBT1685956.1 hypothetical protein [Dawidia soli]
MKKSLLLFTLFVTLLCVTQSCSDEQQQAVTPRDVSFSLGLPGGDNTHGRMAAEIPDGAAVLITLTKPDGTPVLSQERINILHLGNGLVTEPLRLEPGEYTITDFWIVQDSSEVLFLIPQAGSPLATHVYRPVPFNFSVNVDGVTNISVQVVSTENQEPEDFGYASFGISIAPAPSYFRIAVFVASEGGLTMTDAEAVFIETFGPFAARQLAAKINTIEESSDLKWGRGFVLRINKPGYVSIERTMNLSDLALHKDTPLEIVLEQGPPAGSPAMILSGAWMTGPAPELNFRMEGSGVLYAEWGNGFMEKFTFNSGLFGERYNFDYSSLHTITVQGDLDKIVSMTLISLCDPGLKAMDIHALTNLRHFIFGQDFMTHRGTVVDLDLSSQTKLDSISLEFHTAHVILPSQHNLHYVNVYHWVDDYSVFVGNIYNNAVAKNIRNGFFHYGYQTNNQLPQDVVEKLESLREDLGWDVSYH